MTDISLTCLGYVIRNPARRRDAHKGEKFYADVNPVGKNRGVGKDNQDAGNTRQRAVGSRASSRQRGSTVQGTDRRTKTQSEVAETKAEDDTIVQRVDSRHDRPSKTLNGALNTHTAPDKTLDTLEKETDR